MLDQVLAAPANRVGTGEIALPGGLGKDGSCSKTAEAVEVERRRETLINSYTHWTSRRSRRIQRDQAKTMGAVPSFDDSSIQETAGAVLHKRAAAAAEKRQQGVPEVRTLVVASDNGRPSIHRSTGTAGNGRNNRALVLFSPTTGASRQLLLCESLRRARILRRGDDMYCVSRWESLVRRTPPFRGAQLCYDGSSQLELDWLHAPFCPLAEVMERALANVTQGDGCARSIAVHPRVRGAGVCVVACATSACGMPRTRVVLTREVGGSLSNAFPKATATATAQGRSKGNKLEVEHLPEESSPDMIPRRSPVIGADRYSVGSTNFSISRNLPSTCGRFAGEEGIGESDNGQRKRSEAEEERVPDPAARVRAGSSTPAGTPGGTSCRDITVRARASTSEGKIVRRKGCSSVLKIPRQVCGSLSSSTELDCTNTTSMEEKRAERRSPPRHRKRSEREEVTDGNLEALVQAGKTTVETVAAPRIPNTEDDDQQQISPFLGYGGTSRARPNYVAVVLPVGAHFGTQRMAAPQSEPQPVGFDFYDTGGGSKCGGRLLLCNARPRADNEDDLRPSPADIHVRQRRIGHSATLRGSHLPSWPIGPAVKVAAVDSILPGDETRVVPYTEAGSAARTCTSDNTKHGAGGKFLHPTLALQGKGGGRWSGPWSNSCGGVGTTAYQKDLGQVEVPPSCAAAIVPRLCSGEGLVSTPKVVKPAKPPCLPINTSNSRTQAPARAESQISSGTAEVSAQGDMISVADRQEGDEAGGSGEEMVLYPVDDNKRDKGGLLSTTHGGADASELRASKGQELSSVSASGTPGKLPTFPEGPQPRAEAQLPTSSGTYGHGSSASSPLACPLVSPPCSSSLPQENHTERDGTEQAATESASAPPAKDTTSGDSTTGPTPAGSSPEATSPAGFTPRPPPSSPLPRSPPPLRPKQYAPPTTAIADAGAELGSSVELFPIDTVLDDASSDDDERVSSALVVHRRRDGDHDQRWQGLCATGQERAQSEDTEQCETTACM